MLKLQTIDPATITKGGPGSGFHGHAGRPGEVGGSAPAGTATPALTKPQKPMQQRRDALDALRLIAGEARLETFDTAGQKFLDNFLHDLNRVIEGGKYDASTLSSLWQRQFRFNEGMGLARYLDADLFFSLNPANSDIIKEWANEHGGDLSSLWEHLPAWADQQGLSFLNEAMYIVPAWSDIPTDLIEKNLLASDLVHLEKWEQMTGKTIDRGFLMDFVAENGFRNSVSSFIKAKQPVGLLSPQDWADLPDADWRSLLDINKTYNVPVQKELFQAVLGSDLDAKLSDLMEGERGGYAGWLRSFANDPKGLASIISERGDPLGVDRLLTNTKTAAWQFAKPIQRAMIDHTLVADAVTGEMVKPTVGDSRLADWFKERSTGESAGLGKIYRHLDFTEMDAVQAKSDVVAALQDDAGYGFGDADHYYANDFVRQWAATSNDNDMRSLGIQEIAADELGGSLSLWQKERLQSTLTLSQNGEAKAGQTEYLFEAPSDSLDRPILSRDAAKETIRKSVRSVYDRTQAELKRRGIETVTVYRGVMYNDDRADQWNPGDVIKIEANALSSWTTSTMTAHEFSRNGRGNVLSASVPASWVYSTPMTGQGCLAEQEVIIVGKQAFYVRVER